MLMDMYVRTMGRQVGRHLDPRPTDGYRPKSRRAGISLTSFLFVFPLEIRCTGGYTKTLAWLAPPSTVPPEKGRCEANEANRRALLVLRATTTGKGTVQG